MFVCVCLQMFMLFALDIFAYVYMHICLCVCTCVFRWKLEGPVRAGGIHELPDTGLELQGS